MGRGSQAGGGKWVSQKPSQTHTEIQILNNSFEKGWLLRLQKEGKNGGIAKVKNNPPEGVV